MQCPNCLTNVDDETTGCPTCGARWAYGVGWTGDILDKPAHWRARTKANTLLLTL